MEAKIYNQEGKETGKIKLPESVFGLPWNSDLVHQVVVSMNSNARNSVAHTKDRSDVSGGGKKPWRQKGTGRARHGSTRSPIWVGGGVAHGPRNEKDYSRKINKKMRSKALFSILSRKYEDQEMFFVDKFDIGDSKTKNALSALKSLSSVPGLENILKKRNNSTLIAINGKNDNVERSFANFSNILVEDVKNLNPVSALRFKYLLILNPEESIEFLNKKLAK